MISLLFVFCQLAAMQVWWMKGCAFLLQWPQFTWFLQNWNITPVWSTFLAVLAIYRRQRIWWRQCPINHMWVCGRLCSAPAGFMVMWGWENMLLTRLLNWQMKMPRAMCCYQASMLLLLLLATGISVRKLNSRERKEVWRDSWIIPGLKWITRRDTTEKVAIELAGGLISCLSFLPQ